MSGWVFLAWVIYGLVVAHVIRELEHRVSLLEKAVSSLSEKPDFK